MKTHVVVSGLDRNRAPQVRRFFIEVTPAWAMTPMTVYYALAHEAITEQQANGAFERLGCSYWDIRTIICRAESVYLARAFARIVKGKGG